MSTDPRNPGAAASDMLPSSPVDEAIVGRRSIRAFLPEPVPRQTIEHILNVAARTPSGSNIQPWQVRIATGASLERLTRELTATFDAGEKEAPEYDYYPSVWRAPYLERRRTTGWALYALSGIQKGDREGSARQRRRNYTFFDAPVGMVFTIDKDLGRGSWLDFGMFLQSIMIAARGHGLDTCPQAALANYPAVIRRELGVPQTQTVVCGMALGRADPVAPANLLVTTREDLSAFTTFHD